MSTYIIWVLQIALAIWFANAAWRKLPTPAAKMGANKHLPFGGNPVPIKIIGVLELLGVIGIIVPQLIDVYPLLTPIAAIGFAIIMFSAAIFHLTRRNYKVLPVIALTFVAAVAVACYRFLYH